MMLSVRSSALPLLGETFCGGFFAGRYHVDGQERALVLADHSADLAAPLWDMLGRRPRITAAESMIDGMGNTKALAEAGSAVAAKVLRTQIGGVRGWHIPSRAELQVIQLGLLLLPAFGRQGCQSMAGWAGSPGYTTYWSSTMKSASAWNLTMLPWCVPATNWAKDVKGVRPVRSIPIIHEPDARDLPTEGEIVGRLAIPRQPDQIGRVLERFINEDSGRFYGRTEDLTAELAKLSQEVSRHG